MLTRHILATVSVLICVLVVPAYAHAGAYGNTSCSSQECAVTVGTNGQATITSPSTGHATGGGSRSASGGPQVCHDYYGRVIACADQYGSLGSDGCYYQPSSFTPPAGDTFDQHSGPGGWYTRTCITPGRTAIPQAISAPVWVASAPARTAAAPPPNPAVLAAQAESRLPLAAPVIEANPVPAHELVRFPVWVYLGSGSWSARSATASVPGASVTATATPVSVTWDFGDGTAITCHSAGTPWSPRYSATAASPTCGHTYLMSSANQPSQAYPVTATLRWSVTWHGAGAGGAFPDLTRTATAAFRVAQIQTIDVE